MKFDTLLAAISDSALLRNANDTQQVFVLSDAKEAKLAFDVLVAHGFECKFYPENNESKLYVTQPNTDDVNAHARLEAALAYAQALKPIKAAMDAFCQQSGPTLHSPDYSIAFSSLPAAGSKQILINVVPTPSQQARPSAPLAAPQLQAATPKPSVSAPVAAKSKAYMRTNKEETMFSGPSLLQDNAKIVSKKEKAKQESDSLYRQMVLYVKGNSAVAFGIVVTVLVVLLTLFSMFVVSKGFLCPDLARAKDTKTWYCQNPGGEEDDKKTPLP